MKAFCNRARRRARQLGEPLRDAVAQDDEAQVRERVLVEELADEALRAACACRLSAPAAAEHAPPACPAPASASLHAARGAAARSAARADCRANAGPPLTAMHQGGYTGATSSLCDRANSTQRRMTQFLCTAPCIVVSGDLGKQDTLRYGRDVADEQWRPPGTHEQGRACRMPPMTARRLGRMSAIAAARERSTTTCAPHAGLSRPQSLPAHDTISSWRSLEKSKWACKAHTPAAHGHEASPARRL